VDVAAVNGEPHHRWGTVRVSACANVEAPSELVVYLPQFHVVDVAELVTHMLHNRLPLRGAQVRDPKRWSEALNHALVEFGGDAQVMIDQHSWPVWESQRVRTTLARFRDLYKYVHDQTLRMINHGMGPPKSPRRR